MSKKALRKWKEFRLIVTDPPAYKGHFDLIQKHLIPFIEKTGIQFWITNYFSATHDYILFRVKVNKQEQKTTEAFLKSLIQQHEIMRHDPPTDWNPSNDAQSRIISASQKLGLPSNVALKTHGPYVLNQQVPLQDRVRQLELFFTEAVGPCTKVLYKALKGKPTDPWMMSLLLHLVLNSLDINGPNPPCEESSIRNMPVY